MDKKLEHLKLIQNIITRMAGNSFYLKGWTVTLVSAFIALIVSSSNFMYLIVSLIPLILFWLVDGFYISQGRLYCKLYDDVRAKQENEIDFSMDTNTFKDKDTNWKASCFSKTLVPFYGGILVVVVLILLIA